MPIVSVGQITIVDVNDGVDGLDGPALQIISSAAGFTYQDGVASPADQTISFTLLRQGLDNTEANWAASGATLGTNKDRIDITEYIFGLPGTGDGDTAYLTLAQFGTARQMSIGATVGSLAAYANVLRIGDSTAQAGATRNVLSGSWATATAYGVGDIVVSSGFRWICILAHISSGSVMPPVFPATSNLYWRLEGARGALTTSRAIAGSTWVDADAATAIADAGGVSPIQGDVVTLFNTTAGYSETRIRSSAGSWTALSVIFGGNVIVDNTLTASKIRAGAITADKVLITGRGSALNDDPTTSDISAWTLYSGTQPTIETITGAAVGRTAIRGTNSTWVHSRTFAVDVNKKYRLRCWARRDTSGTPASGTFWLRAEWFDSSGTSLSFSDVASTALTSSWLKRDTGELTPPANAVSARVMLILNYNGTTGYHEAQDVRFEEIIGADLIVDGSISALKLSVNSVTAGKIEAGAITADKIAAGAVTASKIAVGDFAVQARNWNFEEGDTQWTKEAGWSVVSDAVNAKSGSWVARFTGTSVAALRNSQFVPAEAGEVFYAEAYVRHAAGSSGVGGRVRIQFRDAAGADISFANGNLVAGTTTAYTKSFIQGTAPANTATVRVEVTSQLTAGTAYIDEVRLFRASGTTLIADGAVTTAKIGVGEVKAGNIEAGAVSADKIAAGSITASKIAVGDFQNLCPNPSGETGVDGWTTGVVTGPNTGVGGLPAAVKSLRTINRDAYIGPWFDVTPGDQFYLSGSFYPAQAGDNPPTADAAVMIRFADDVGGTNSVWLTSAYAVRTTNSWQTVEGNVTVPASKRFAMMALQIDGTAGSTGSWHFRNIQVRRRNGGALIVDGAISTNKLDAGAVTAAKISAGAITTSKLLVVPASICPDPYFTDEAWWTATQLDANGWFFESGTAINVPKQAALWSGATTPPGTTRKHLWSGNVTAPAVGSTLRLRARVSNGSNHAAYVAARFYNSAGSSVGSDITLTSNAGAGTQDLTGQGVVPANAATIRFIIYNAAPGAAFSGFVQVSAVMLDVAASADLIVDGAVTASKISAGAITTDKLLVTGRGKALNDDPTFQDVSAWSQTGGGGSYALVTESTSPSGTRVLRATDAVQFSSRQFPIVAGTRYKVSMWSRRTAGTASMYLRLYCYNAAGALVNYVVTPLSGTGDLENIAVPSSWTKYTGYVDAGAATVNGILIVHVNWTTTGTTDVADCRVEEYIGADLIVDGAITATKLAANSIAVGTAAIQNGAIVNAMIADTTITNAKISDLSAAKINAGTLDAARIAAGSISASKLAAGSVTADKILVTGRGSAINDDPNAQDITAWSGGNFSIVADTSSPTGTAVSVISTGATTLSGRFPLDATKNYDLRITAKLQSGAATAYLLMAFYDGSDQLLSASSYPAGWPNGGTFHYFGLAGETPPSSYTEYRVSFGPNETRNIPAGAKFGRVGMLANYSGGSGEQRFTSFRLVEKTTASLIVNGSITADKIDTRGLDIKDASGNVVFSSGPGSAVSAVSGQLRIQYPGGGSFDSNNPSLQGAIWIIPPQAWSGTMMRFEVEIYEYSDGSVQTYEVGGYNYDTGSWYNTHATYRGKPSKVRPVTFGYDNPTGRPCIILGTFAGTWAYPKVTIKNFLAGYSNFAASQWSTGWSVSIQTSRSHTGQVVYSNPVIGGAFSGLDQITDTNVSTYIANAAINTAQIANAAITTALIANANITEAKIADANITTAKIADANITSAKIGDAQVSTLKIAGNAVTVPSSSELTSEVTFNNAGASSGATAGVSILSFSMDTAGQPVLVFVNYGIRNSAATSGTCICTLVINSSVERQFNVTVGAGATVTGSFSAVVISPGSGSYTVDWRLRAPVAGSNIYFATFGTSTPTELSALGAKR